MKKTLLIAAILLSACSAALPSPAVAPTPLAWRVQVTPALGWYAAALNACVPVDAGAHIILNQVPTARMVFTAAEISLRWGAPPSLDLPAVILGEEELAFIVHPGNPVTRLSAAELRGLLSGKTLTWETLSASAFKEPVSIYLYDSGEDIMQLLDSALANLPANRQNAWLAPDPAAVLDAVAAAPGAVGFVPQRLAGSTVKAVTITDIPASALRRPLLAVTPQLPQGLLQVFLQCAAERGD